MMNSTKASYRITDAHHHLWTQEEILRTNPRPEIAVLINDYLPETLRPLLDEVGVDDTVLVQTAPHSMANTYQFLDYAEANDWIAAVVGWVDLTDPGVGDTLDELAERPKFKGVRHLWEMEPHPAWIVRDDVLRGLGELAKRSVPYDLLGREAHWPYISQVARAVPDLALVIDHIAKPNIRVGQFDEWSAAMSAAAEFPQMMCKLSGMITEADPQHWTPSDLKPYVDRTIELFGLDRVMFGSDWPVCLLAGSYAQVFHALQECLEGLSETEKAKVMGQNARRFYGID
jgi:L-fuconolactonase